MFFWSTCAMWIVVPIKLWCCCLWLLCIEILVLILYYPKNDELLNSSSTVFCAVLNEMLMLHMPDATSLIHEVQIGLTGFTWWKFKLCVSESFVQYWPLICVLISKNEDGTVICMQNSPHYFFWFHIHISLPYYQIVTIWISKVSAHTLPYTYICFEWRNIF